MHTLLQDLRYALRNLMKAPGFTAVAVATLAIGIGANTAIFSIIDTILLRPLPYKEPAQLLRLYETEAAPGHYPFAGPDYLDWKAQNNTLQGTSLFGWGNDMNLSGQGEADHVIGVPTEANFFSLLGVNPIVGRTWAPDEDQPGKDQVAILSYNLWQSRFGGDRNVVNRTIELNSKKFTIVGVMPANFRFPSQAQLWVPLDINKSALGDNKWMMQRGSHWANAVGRMKPGVTPQRAQADLVRIAGNLEKQFPDSNHKVGAAVVPLHDDLVGGSRDSLVMMLWAVGLVLLIACANIANLLLSRAVARQKEMAVRSALGAARGRLVRQLLTESVLLSFMGGIIGLLLAWGCIQLFSGAKSFALPTFNVIQLNGTVLLYTFGLALATGILFGFLPALQTSRPDLHEELKGGAGSSVSPGKKRRYASNILVVGEIALSMLLLISAGLLLTDFARLRNGNIGVEPKGVWSATVNLPAAKYKTEDQTFSFSETLLQRARQIPGVETAAISNRMPLEGGSNYYVHIRGRVFSPMSGVLVESHAVTPDYFSTMKIHLLRGRLTNATDVQQAKVLSERMTKLFAEKEDPPPEQTNAIIFPVVINQAMARSFWPNENPLGQMFAPGSNNGPWRQVVGVVSDVKQWGLTQPPQPEAYDTYTGDSRFYLVLHTSLAPASLTPEVRRVLSQVDSSLPLFQVRTMDQVIAENAQGQEFLSLLVGSFAALAVLLAAIGIYGVLSYVVTQRTREIGIRMSLGASRGRVLGSILRDGMLLAAIGFAVGIVGALAAGRVMASLLHEVKPGDPIIFISTAALLTAIALAACYIPARRAARLDPMAALRHE